MRSATALALSLVFLAACNESPTEPHGGMATLVVSCNPSGSNIVCRASATNLGGVISGDVTREATWLHNTRIGEFAEPGVFVPSTDGEVDISAKFSWLESSKHSYVVSPTAPPRRLFFVGGNITDAATNEKIVGATVRILDGYAAGRAAVSNSLGYYSIDRVLTDETFTLEVTMEGYARQVLTYRIGTQPFFNVALTRT